MTNEQFQQLVRKLEEDARKSPGWYRLRVGLLAILGYGYIFLVLAGLLVAIAFLVFSIIYMKRASGSMLRLIIFLLIPLGVGLQSLWVSFPPPTGIELHRHQVPHLYELIDELVRKLHTPGFHCVLLTDEFNAAVCQHPRLGILGWQQNYLILGLPLLQALSPEQFRAVLAHELGHLSGNHSRFGGWIYRVRQTWSQMLERLQKQTTQGSEILFHPFFRWYAPFFEAYSFVLARGNEYEADRCAAQLAGATLTAEALISSAVKVRFLQESFWAEIHHQADDLPNPSATPFQSLSVAFQEDIEPECEQKWLMEAIEQKTNYDDTHPCLVDRLHALGYASTPSLTAPIQQTAADRLLGAMADELAKRLDKDWQTNITFGWRERYNHIQQMRESRQCLRQKAAFVNLTISEEWQLAKATLELDGDAAARPLLEAILQTQPEHVGANYELGRILILANDDLGVEYLETAMSREQECTPNACRLLYDFYQARNREPEAKKYAQKIQAYFEKVALAEQERSRITESDGFLTHDFSPEVIDGLKQKIARYPEIKTAYLVKKKVKYFPEKPIYVVGVVRQIAWYKLDRESAAQKLLARLGSELTYPAETLVIVLEIATKSIHNKIHKNIASIAKAKIYDRALEKKRESKT